MVDYYGTVREQKNIPTLFSETPSMINLFGSEQNRLYLANKLYLYNKENGGHAPLHMFMELTNRLTEKYAREKKIGPANTFYYADDDPETFDRLKNKQNWIESFRALNMDFLLWSRRFLKENIYVPYRGYTTTGSLNEFENNVRDVSNHNLLSEDIKEINVWKKYDINKKNSHFRYENNIPFWQRSMNIRHADRSNEGLREGNDSFRSSLDNPVYGYDMKEIYKIVNN